mmetsp:Transcript_28308/g.91617  ORF Transcript_28308/g.91617 Transcript_28308/m.91617 type:complete len:365 (+) Transcript_28308:1884-2978(+)
MVDGVERSSVRQKCLRGANVGVGLLSANVLLARLEGETVGRVSGSIARQPDDAARHCTLVRILAGKEGGMRSSIPKGDTKTLSVADYDVSSDLTGGLQHGQRQEIRDHHDGDFVVIRLLDDAAVVMDRSVGSRVGEEDAHQGRVHLGILNLADDDFDVHRLSTSLADGDGLRVAEIRDEHLLPLGLADSLAHSHGLSSSSGLIKEGGLSNIHGRDVSDHGLVVDQRLHTTLGNLGLVRGVRSVPPRVLDDIPEDGRGGDGVVVAHTDVRLLELVLGHHVEQLQGSVGLRHGLSDLEGRAVADAAGDRLLNELLHRGCSDGGEHVLLLVVAGPVVSPLELVRMLQPGGGSKRSGVHERLALSSGE